MRAKKGTKMAAATELLLVYVPDESTTVVTGPSEYKHVCPRVWMVSNTMHARY